MASTEPLAVDASLLGWVRTTLRVFVRAPVFFTLLLALQALSSLLMNLVAPSILPVSSIGVIEFVVSEIVFALVQAPVLERASRLMAGEATSPRRLLAVSVDRAAPMVAMIFVQLVIVALGAIALIIPGIIALLAFALAGPVCLVERAGPLKSLSRSVDLTRGVRWRILGAVVLIFAPMVLIIVGWSFITTTSAAATFIADRVFDLLGAVVGGLETILAAVIYRTVHPDQERGRITEVFG